MKQSKTITIWDENFDLSGKFEDCIVDESCDNYELTSIIPLNEDNEATFKNQKERAAFFNENKDAIIDALYEKIDWDFEFENAINYLGDIIREHKMEIVSIKGSNINWRGQSGEKEVELDFRKGDYELGLDFLNSILGNVRDFRLTMERPRKNAKTLCFQMYHHDCPTGSCFDVTRIKKLSA
jgi:hypothetical protein